MQIGGLQKTSLLDYPDKISAIVFTKGCNFRCGYCHNSELIDFSDSLITEKEFFNFLEKRLGKLDGIVITGGEPCLQLDLLEFIRKIKNIGFLVKLDTNGSNPKMLNDVLNDVDYIAMDIKAPLEKYPQITRVNIDTEKIKKSINIIKNSGIDYEFRTTVVKSQLSFEDFEQIGKLINGAKKYYLQKFVPQKTLDKNMMNEITYSNQEFEQIKKILNKYIENVSIR